MSSRREYEMFFKITGAMGGSFSEAMRNASSEMKALRTATSTLNSQMRDISAYQRQQKAIERQNEIIRTSRTRLEELKARQQELTEEMRNTANPSERLRGQFERNAEQVRRCENALAEHNQRLSEMQTGLEQSRQDLEAAGINTDDLSGSMQNLQQQLDKISRTRNFLSNVSEELDTTRAQFKEATKEFAQLGGGIAAGVGAVYASASKPAMEFESAFTGVRKTVDATDEEFARIRKDIIDMSQSGEVAASADEIAAVAEAAGQLGIQTESISKFSKVMINLGDSTNLSADEAASELAKFANVTQMSQNDFDRLGSVIVDLGNNFATTEADIVSMGTRLASTGNLTGLSQAQIMAAATALSSLGIEAEAGGSAMSKVLKSLQLAVETGDGLEEYAKVANVSQEEFKKMFRDDALKAISAFTNGLNDVERNGKSAVAILDDMGIKEVRMSNAVLSLASSDDILTKAAGLANNAWEENTALAAEAEKRYETTESKITIAKNAVENLGITIGDMTLPMIKNLAEEFTEAAMGAQRWVSENQEGIARTAGVAKEVAKYALILKGTQVAYLGVKTGALAAMKGVGKVVAAFNTASIASKGNKLSAFVSSLTGLSGAGAVASAAVGGVVAAIVALGAVIAVNIKEFQHYRKELTDKELFDNGGKSLKEYTEELKNSTSEHYKYAQEVNSASEELDNIEYEMSKAKGSLELYNQILEENGTLTSEQAEAMYEPFDEFATSLEKDFKGRYQVVFNAFKTSAVGAAEQLGISVGKIETVLEGFKSRFDTNLSEAQEIVTGLLDKQKNGETLTDEDWADYNKAIQYQIDIANAAPNSTLSEFNAMKEELSGWDFGKNQQTGIDNLNELAQYAADYIKGLDDAQKKIHAENVSLMEYAEIDLKNGNITEAEYNADIKAMKQAEQIAYDTYKTNREEFISDFDETWDSFYSQIDKTVTEGMEKAGFNLAESFLNNLKGTVVGFAEQFAYGVRTGGYLYTPDQLYSGAVGAAKADEYKLAAAKGEYQGLYDAAGQYNSGDFGSGAKNPGYSDTLDELRVVPGTLSSVGPVMISPELPANIPGHANGSTFTENAFIAGENGPELIVGAPGRTVFTAAETSMLLGIMPQALSLMSAASRNPAPVAVNVTVNSTFAGSSGDYSGYNDDLVEKICRRLDEKMEDVRRNAYY